MALSRLQNFLNNPTGVVLFVDSANFDATDGIENRGTSPGRPFITLQRACIEAARFSFQKGKNNDLNDRTTILVSPGKHYIDNRPGFSIEDANGIASVKKRTGKDTWVSTPLVPFNENSNFDLFDPNNDLYKYNSVNGGLILPRGTSIIAQDLRKTKIVPLYVPDPLDSEVERSSIFNVTGSCYFKEFTIFDADVTKFSYKNYSDTKHVPKYSHHKLTAFVYADGVNEVIINSEPTGLTDLDMYYHKITVAYDNLSNRGLDDFPENLDFEPNINEFRIVGPLQETPLGISSIRAGNGDGSGDNSIITITTEDLISKTITPHEFAVDTPVIIRGITESPESYNGTFTVREVVNENTFTIVTTSIPDNVAPSPITYINATVATESDTTDSSSPYVFGCSIKSTKGICGLWADGNKALGFQSMVVAQLTGISLQTDDDAYLIYDNGVLYDNTTLPSNSSLRPLYQNSRSFYKPEFENFHIRASNNAFIQAVSVFAIGYCNQFITESGADMSVTNSNSNFGATALSSIGFKKEAFARDDVGYITHILLPKEIENREVSVPWISLDINKIKTSLNDDRLYLSKFDSRNDAPLHKIENYRIGARVGDSLFIDLNNSSPIIMPVPIGTIGGDVAKKEYQVTRVSGVNNISSSGIITLSGNHSLFSGEKVRLFSNTGIMPNGLESNKVYYVITSTISNELGPNQIKLSNTSTEALSNNPITELTNGGGVISVISSVTDKFPGEPGHPIQWDENLSNWYIQSSSGETNKIRTKILEDSYPEEIFGNETPITFIRRIPDSRRIDERIYKVRYVIPKEFTSAKPPQAGYSIQESGSVEINSISVDIDSELSDSTQIRNDKVIVNATVSSLVEGRQVATITTELAHNLISGDIVNIKNVKSSNNPTGLSVNKTYNGEQKVIQVLSPRTFTYELLGVKADPGTFINNINQRSTAQERESLPVLVRRSYRDNFYIYKVETIKRHIPGNDGQDGVYYLILLSSSVRYEDGYGYGLNEKLFNPDVKNLYPQIDRDNSNSNPKASISYPELSVIGKVSTDDKRNSITLESINKFTKNTRVAFNITGISISGIGNTTLTLTTDINHKLNSISRVSFVNTGSGYPENSILYSQELIDSLLLQENSTCNFRTTVDGNIDPNTFKLVDAGSGHIVGETLEVSGGTTPAIVRVEEIINNVGDTLELSGFIDTIQLNGIYKILSIPSKNSIIIEYSSGLDNYISNSNGSQPFGYISSKGISIFDMQLSDLSTGIATVTTNNSHELFAGNKFKIINSNNSYYDNKDFIVNSVVGIKTFTFNVGSAPNSDILLSGDILKYGITSNSLDLGVNEENLVSRGYTFYSGLCIELTQELNSNDDTEITVNNSNGIYRGDFITINTEILRVSSNPSNNIIKVIRGQLGTIPTNAEIGSVVKKIRVLPTEIRRPSSLRASAQTFEYVGYGPGNYSTALPQRQDRILDESEVLVSQAKKQSSGSIVYTGMNDLGEFYTGSKKISTATGEETILEAPIITYTGDDLDGDSSKKQIGTFDEVLVRDKIVVEGGKDGNQSSQFYGPVSFDKKLTNLSEDGVLVSNLFIRGKDVGDKLIGVNLPSDRNKLGNISIISDPSEVNHIGSVFKSNEWRPFGPISLDSEKLDFKFDKVGIGTTSDSYSLNVAGDTNLQNLEVTGFVTLPTLINLGDITFEEIVVGGTAKFTGSIGNTYTQIHETGISLFNDVEVVGVSTFTKDVYIQKASGSGTDTPTLYTDKLEISDNIKIGIADGNTIETKVGNLVISPDSKNSIFNSNIVTNDGDLVLTNNLSSGIVTATIAGGNALRLGVGHTNRTSYIDLINDSRETQYGLRIIRDSGVGETRSQLIHRGSKNFDINAYDSAEIRLLTNNIKRLSILPNGSIVSYVSTSGVGINDCNLRLNQNGTGNASLFWDITRNNANRRWYAGIDVNDNFSWKLAAPLSTISYGNESFTNDTKLKVDLNGNLFVNPGGLSVSGISTLNRTNINGNLLVSGISTFTKSITGTISTSVLSQTSNQIYRVGVSTEKNTNYRVLLGNNNNNVGFSSAFVVNDEARLYYNPSKNTLTTNLDGTASNATNADTAKDSYSIYRKGVSKDEDGNYRVILGNSNTNIAGFSSAFVVNDESRLYYNPSKNTLTTNLDGTASNLSRSVIAGAGLTGGGTLTSNVTLNVTGATNGGITVDENSISVDGTVIRTTGTQSITGNKTFVGSEGRIGLNDSGNNRIEINSDDAAYMTFHRPGKYAVKFGLDTDDVMKVGGWAMGNSSYPILLGNDHINKTVSTLQIQGSLSNSNPGSGMAFISARDKSGYIFVNDNLMRFLSGPAGAQFGAWSDVPFTLNLTDNSGALSGNFSAAGNITAYSSDKRLKENLNSISSAVEKVQKLNGYTFDWKDEVSELGFTPTHKKNDIGLLAQEVQEVIPQAVAHAPFDRKWNSKTNNYESKSGEDYLTVQYEKLVPLLVEAIKEQNEKIEILEKRIKELENSK